MTVDVSKIDGYAEMSAEEKVKALEALNLEDEDMKAELERYKNANSKANSEAAEYKRKLKEMESKAAAGTSDTEKQMAELKEQIETLQREKSLSEKKASFLKLGMNEELANKCSEAFVNGDGDSLFEGMTSFMDAHDKAFKAELLKTTPRPKDEGGNPPPAMTLEKFRSLSTAEKMAFADDFPDEYEKLYGGK